MAKPIAIKERGKSYLQHLPQAQVRMIQGRNVLPVESTSELVRVVTDFGQQYNW